MLTAMHLLAVSESIAAGAVYRADLRPVFVQLLNTIERVAEFPGCKVPLATVFLPHLFAVAQGNRRCSIAKLTDVLQSCSTMCKCGVRRARR